MAIIVDKVQKRKDIALACVELFTQSGINGLTISQVAKTAGIGKGTVYEYFLNKEDIVFEILNVLMLRHNEAKIKKLSHVTSTKEKLKIFFDFFHNENDRELRQIYKEFISINLSNPNADMIEFQTKCFNTYHTWVEEIVQAGIRNNEILPQATKLVKGLFALTEGMFISSVSTNAIDDLEKEINDYIDALFELIEVKK
ncbi:TetR/AcrR family transcriptional regulator [bacterium]|nr:TetR/AcrR family transcriptional regulator [bacterium]MBU1995174.1 TetR/AcrR family transcriptional regulator [bacterium]